MDSGFNIKDSSLSFFDGEYLEIGSSQRFRYSKTRLHGELLFVKEPTDEYAHDLVTIEALKKEFLLGFRLNHPGIARYYSFENNRLLEEYIEGKTIRQMIDEDAGSLYKKEFVLDITRQILEALKYLHAQGIAHLDLKPENIMVSNLGNRIKIIDLSCAESMSGFSTPGFTKEYRAPEQVYGQGNIATDIYQLGLILKEITEATSLGKVWKKFINKATANHPDNRYRNAEEALTALPSGKKINYRWISAIILTLIVGGLLAVIVTDPDAQKTEDKEEETIMAPSSTGEMPKTVEGTDNRADQTNFPEVKRSVTVAPEEIERKLSRMIEIKLDELYSAKVIPMYEKMMADESYKFKEGRSQEFINAYSKELDNLRAYGEELKKEFPDQAIFIDERIVKTFETKTSGMILKLYPYDN